MNTIKRAIQNGRSVRGVHLSHPSAFAIPMFAQLDVEFLYLDGEHGTFDVSEIWRHCNIAQGVGITPIARVPDRSAATITRFLDQGVKGIVVPHIDSAEDARAVVAAAYFAPLGSRTYGGGFPVRRDKAAMPAFLEERNQGVSVSVMIESGAGIEAAGEIAAVDGIDYLSFGMMDLAQSLGFPGQPHHPTVMDAVQRASDQIRISGKLVREDFMRFAWMEDILLSGCQSLLAGEAQTTK